MAINKDEQNYEFYKILNSNDVLTYDDVVYNAKPSSSEYIKQFKRKNDEFVNALNKHNIRTKLQDERSEKSFRHIYIGEDNQTKYRIYLCPQLNNLHSIIKMLIGRNSKINNAIHLKYSTDERRTDRLVIYLQDQKGVEIQEEILKQMRIERPELFENMQRALTWMNESQTNKDVYIEKEPKLPDTSYSKEYIKAVKNAYQIAKWCSKNTHEPAYQIYKMVLENQLNQLGIGETNIPLTENRVFVDDNNLYTEQPLNNTFSKYRMYTPERCVEYLNNIHKVEKVENIHTYVANTKEVIYWNLYPKNRSSSLQEYLIEHNQDKLQHEQSNHQVKSEELRKLQLIEQIKEAQQKGKDLEIQIAKTNNKDILLEEKKKLFNRNEPQSQQDRARLIKEKIKLFNRSEPRNQEKEDSDEPSDFARGLKKKYSQPKSNQDILLDKKKIFMKEDSQPKTNYKDKMKIFMEGNSQPKTNHKDKMKIFMKGHSPQEQEMQEENGLNNTRARGWSR